MGWQPGTERRPVGSFYRALLVPLLRRTRCFLEETLFLRRGRSPRRSPLPISLFLVVVCLSRKTAFSRHFWDAEPLRASSTPKEFIWRFIRGLPPCRPFFLPEPGSRNFQALRRAKRDSFPVSVFCSRRKTAPAPPRHSGSLARLPCWANSTSVPCDPCYWDVPYQTIFKPYFFLSRRKIFPCGTPPSGSFKPNRGV